MKYLVFILVMVVLSSCKGTPVSDSIDSARFDIDNGQPDRAAATITAAVECKDSISVAELLDVSILLIHASEDSGNEEYIAQATRWYRRAYGIDSVAVQAYVDTLSTADMSRAMLLEQLRRSLDSPTPILPDTLEIE